MPNGKSPGHDPDPEGAGSASAFASRLSRLSNSAPSRSLNEVMELCHRLAVDTSPAPSPGALRGDLALEVERSRGSWTGFPARHARRDGGTRPRRTDEVVEMNQGAAALGFDIESSEDDESEDDLEEGDEVYCGSCGAPKTLGVDAETSSGDDGEASIAGDNAEGVDGMCCGSCGAVVMLSITQLSSPVSEPTPAARRASVHFTIETDLPSDEVHERSPTPPAWHLPGNGPLLTSRASVPREIERNVPTPPGTLDRSSSSADPSEPGPPPYSPPRTHANQPTLDGPSSSAGSSDRPPPYSPPHGISGRILPGSTSPEAFSRGAEPHSYCGDRRRITLDDVRPLRRRN